MELVEMFRNLILLVLALALVVCVGPVSRVDFALVAVCLGALCVAMRHASRPRLLPVHGDPGSRAGFVL